MHCTLASHSSLPVPPHFPSFWFIFLLLHLFVSPTPFVFHFTYFACSTCFLFSSCLGIPLFFQILIPRQYAIYYLYRPQNLHFSSFFVFLLVLSFPIKFVVSRQERFLLNYKHSDRKHAAWCMNTLLTSVGIDLQLWSLRKMVTTDLMTVGEFQYSEIGFVCTYVHSSVGIATSYGLDGPGIESRWGRDFPHPSIPALEPTQPPVQWVPALSRE